MGSETESATDGSTGGSGDPGTGTTGNTASAGTGSGSSGDTGSGDTSTGGSSGGVATCEDGGPCPNVVLMGYWPPTNEMLRQWSTNPAQNNGQWEGKNWLGLGYDVYSFFPEFPPDGDPSNDDIGDEGAVGSPDSDLRVDYQDTSEDFWRIVDDHAPVILITTSRGGMIGWEVEAVEGGHGDPGPTDPSTDWASDGWPPETHPTMDTIEARSWDAISTYRQGNTLPSQLPLDLIVDAVETLGLAPSVAIDTDGTSGNFLSGFLGLHGVYYNEITPQNLTAGHIHVGRMVSAADATAMMEATVQVVLETFPPP